MKKKRGQEFQWSRSERFVWFVYGMIAIVLVFILFSLMPQHFEISAELMPTAEYLREFPQEHVFEIIVNPLSEADGSQYDVCIQVVGKLILNSKPSLNDWQMYIDGHMVRSLSTIRTVDGFFHCASHIYLAKGLHLVEYQIQDTIYNQSWSIEIE